MCVEVEALLRGRPLQKITQPDDRSLCLGFKGVWLYVSVDSNLGRIHLIDKPAGTGESAPPFCMLLRKHLLGERLTAIVTVGGERAVALEFGSKRLLVFLYGRSGQLVLVGEAAKPLGAIGGARIPRTELPEARQRSEENRFGESPGISDRIRAQYESESDRRSRDGQREQAMREARTKLERHRRLEAALASDLSKVDDAAEKRKWADLLLAHLADVPRGAKEVSLHDDFTDTGELTIKLDPAISAQKNAEKFYKDHKRLERARHRIKERLSEVSKQRIESELLLEQLATLSDDQIMGLISSRPTPQSKRGRRAVRRPPYHEFRSSTGGVIWVGRGADRNDELTFKVARGADLWLNARDVAGAHVIVPLASGRTIDEQTLLDAATLAAHHSQARGDAQVDVSYTLRKKVRKPPKAPPGTVLTSGTKTLRVRLEPARLARLLKTRKED